MDTPPRRTRTAKHRRRERREARRHGFTNLDDYRTWRVADQLTDDHGAAPVRQPLGEHGPDDR